MGKEDEERLKDRILSEKMWGELGQIRELLADVATKGDIRNLQDSIDELKAVQQVHGDILTEHSTTLREHSADIKEIKQFVVQNSEDITELKIDVTELKSDVKEIKDAVVGVQATSHTHA